MPKKKSVRKVLETYVVRLNRPPENTRPSSLLIRDHLGSIVTRNSSIKTETEKSS